MFKHIFKLTWNKRRQNFLFLSEILVSFMVIFAVASLLVFYYTNYKKPQGIDDKRVWAIGFGGLLSTQDTDSVQIFIENLKQNLKSLPQIQEMSFTHANFPYSNSTSSTGMSHNGKSIHPINYYTVDESFAEVTGMKVLEGRWFTKEDGPLHKDNLVINASLKKAMFGDEPAVGKLFGGDEESTKRKVIGVVEDVKAGGDYWPAGPGMYKKLDTASFKWVGNILIKVSPDADAAFESRLHKLLARAIKNSNLEIQQMENMRASKNKEATIPMIVCITIAGFLIINVALGLFGVLWYNISQRRSEIGLRRAMGASGSAVSFQLVFESLMLTTLSIVVGTFFAIQFPLLNVFNVPANVYIIALLFSIAFVYTLVILCSLYPGRQAAAIHPAIALHEE
jgi:putative ABC transport system permease protein